jgi:dihydroorotate dehydrogenase (NAD+) catalytic subunit
VILNASGCLDALTAPDVARQLDAFVTKTVTPLPREGNAPVRIAETDAGMLNSIGLANPGIDSFVAEVLPRLLRLGPPIWVSVGGFAPDDYADLCSRLDATACAAIELNLSCPNVAAPEGEAAEIVSAARAATRKPLYAKLSPALPDVAAVALRAAEAGADGLSLVNTIRGLALDPEALAPRLSTVTGGLSGPALRPIALAAVHACYQETGLPIVGMGGVETGRHALELVAVGASDVALGTVLFADPGAPARVRRELAAEAARRGFDDPSSARGVIHEPAERDTADAVGAPDNTARERSVPVRLKL